MNNKEKRIQAGISLKEYEKFARSIGYAPEIEDGKMRPRTIKEHIVSFMNHDHRIFLTEDEIESLSEYLNLMLEEKSEKERHVYVMTTMRLIGEDRKDYWIDGGIKSIIINQKCPDKGMNYILEMSKEEYTNLIEEIINKEIEQRGTIDTALQIEINLLKRSRNAIKKVVKEELTKYEEIDEDNKNKIETWLFKKYKRAYVYPFFESDIRKEFENGRFNLIRK